MRYTLITATTKEPIRKKGDTVYIALYFPFSAVACEWMLHVGSFLDNMSRMANDWPS